MLEERLNIASGWVEVLLLLLLSCLVSLFTLQSTSSLCTEYYNNNKIKCRCCWKIYFLWFYFLYKLKLGPTKTRKFSSLIPLPSGVDIECLLATTKLFKSGAYLMNRVRQSCRRHRNKSIQHHQLAKNRREVIKTPFLNGEFHSRPEPNQIEK